MPFITLCLSVGALGLLVPIYLMRGMPLVYAISAALVQMLPGLLLGTLAWKLLTRLRPVRSGARGLAEHALIGSMFSTAWTAALAGLTYLFDPQVALDFVRNNAGWQVLMGLIVYAALAAAANALQAQARLRERELAAAGAELQALRARLDPHFLFNTLHSLTQLAKEDPAATQEALERFGDLMRYVLHSGRAAGDDVSLENEIGFVRNYLALERLRLGERLCVVEKLEPDALELGVPPLLLQPLVENSVRHGLAPRRKGGTIWISARTLDSSLVLEVTDDGSGADPDAWRSSKGLGLQAVRRQVEAGFPRDGEVQVRTRRGKGFTVQIKLPARLPAASPA